MATIELNPTIVRTITTALKGWASKTEALAQACQSAGLTTREEARPYIKEAALRINPLQEGQDYHNSSAERIAMRALAAVFGKGGNAGATRSNRESIKVNRARVARIVAELSGLTKAEVNATLAAVREAITFE